MRVAGHKEIPFIRDLLKGHTDEKICEAEDNFRRYLRLVMRIAERLAGEEEKETSKLSETKE